MEELRFAGWLLERVQGPLNFEVSLSQVTKLMSKPRSLLTRLILRTIISVIIVMVFLFLPAGTFRYWQGWAFMALWFLPMLIAIPYFLERDPQLVERRLQTKEKSSEQKIIIRLAQPVMLASLF